jgi:hypothetical protein
MNAPPAQPSNTGPSARSPTGHKTEQGTWTHHGRGYKLNIKKCKS